MRDNGASGGISPAMLAWYDVHARDLAWRVGPAARRIGARPDPYRVWLSEIMLQQTTVAAVTEYFRAFTTRWPDVAALAAAPDDQVMAAWAGLGYYARARNLLKCARTVAHDLGGRFPEDPADLQRLPGIGPYTSAAIAAIAFDHPATVVDGNVERVMARLHDIHTPLPGAKGELTDLARSHTPQDRAGDYAQSVMDLGATICTPRKPACGICPVNDQCAARRAGTQADLPAKTPRKAKPVRHGRIYLARRADGAWLMERRPDRGLLGGMMGWPGTDWTEGAAPPADPPIEADWQALPGEVRHTFTHFHLRLQVMVAHVESGSPLRGDFMPRAQFSPADLPTVMRKAFDLTQGHDLRR